MRDKLIKIVSRMEELFFEFKKKDRDEIIIMVMRIDRMWNEFKKEILKTFS
jgi:hypothetical protein